jgi:hypothetical protein
MTDRTEELLDEIAAYADRLADSDELADKGSMATAEALAELYEKREWVAEWLEQKPIHERKAYIGGRPPEPDSRNRFSQWLVWKEDQRQRRALVSRHTYRLLNAHEVQGYLTLGQITSERTVRPFDWFRKNRYFDRIPEVEKRAIALAGSADRVTGAHTRQAVADWKREVLGVKGVKEAVRTAKAERDRIKAQAAIRQLVADGDEGEMEKFHRWYVDLARSLNEKAARP